MDLLSGALAVAVSLSSYSIVFLEPADLVDARNVVLAAQKPDETVTLIPGDPALGSLWYCPAGVHRRGSETYVWYQRVNTGEEQYSDKRTLCLGVVTDGTWNFSRIDQEPPAWGGANNVVMRRSPHPPTWGGFNVFQIVRVGMAFRMLYWDQPPEGPAGALLAGSLDGVHWVKDDRGAVFTEYNDPFSLIRKGRGFYLYQTALEDWPDKPYPDNLDKKRRVQSFRTSHDLVHWTAQDIFLRPDDRDRPETEFYLMKVFQYADRYAGILFKYFGDPQRPNRHSALYEFELVVSADGRSWRRPFREPDLGFWTYADPFIDRGKLCFVCGEGAEMNMVMYRPNGLTAVVAGQEPGEFTTRPFPVSDEVPTINADARDGWVEIRLLTEDATPVAGAAPWRIEGVDGDRMSLAWNQRVWRRYKGKDIRLHARMQNAKLYAIGR